MGIPLQRFDMSEYMERHSVSRLIGAPPGYVGYDQGGLLTDAVDQQPHCVLLLDEIEKAHPDLFNILLQVMDNGKLTDHHGKTVDFRNVILIMTTNAGASDMARESIGFGDLIARGRAGGGGARRCSRRNSATGSMRSCRSAICRPRSSRGWSTSSSSSSNCSWPTATSTSSSTTRRAQWLTERGYDKLYGARPMGRLIQEKIKQPLAEELLFGKLVHGGEVKVRIKDNALAFEIVPAAAQADQSRKPKAKAEGRGRSARGRVDGLAEANKKGREFIDSRPLLHSTRPGLERAVACTAAAAAPLRPLRGSPHRRA